MQCETYYIAGQPLLIRRCTRLPGRIRLQSDRYCDRWGVKLTHSLPNIILQRSDFWRTICLTEQVRRMMNQRPTLLVMSRCRQLTVPFGSEVVLRATADSCSHDSLSCGPIF